MTPTISDVPSTLFQLTRARVGCGNPNRRHMPSRFSAVNISPMATPRPILGRKLQVFDRIHSVDAPEVKEHGVGVDARS